MSLKESLERRDETDDDFAARVERADSRFRNFEDSLKTLDACEVLQHIGKPAVEAAYKFATEEVRRWAQMCVRAPAGKRRQLANIALTIGSVISEDDDKLAAELFEKYATVKPTLNLKYDLRELAHSERSLWTGCGGPEMAALRTRHLDEATTDQALADNVDAAITGGQEWSLRQYVETNIQSLIPAVRARALTVAGLMNEDPWIDSMFDSVPGDLGLVADALDAARHAYDRNRWSKHWVAKMSDAPSAAQFWLGSKLLRKIVDFRLEFWARHLAAPSPLGSASTPQFDPTFKSGSRTGRKSEARRYSAARRRTSELSNFSSTDMGLYNENHCPFADKIGNIIQRLIRQGVQVGAGTCILDQNKLRRPTLTFNAK